MPVIAQHREQFEQGSSSVERITLYNALCCRIGWRKSLRRSVNLALILGNTGMASKVGPRLCEDEVKSCVILPAEGTGPEIITCYGLREAE